MQRISPRDHAACQTIRLALRIGRASDPVTAWCCERDAAEAVARIGDPDIRIVYRRLVESADLRREAYDD